MTGGPVLQAARLALVPFSEQHLTERYVGWLNDPEVVRYSEQRHHMHTLESCRRYYGSLIGTSDYFWAIEALDTALGHVGNIGVTVDRPNGVGDVAIILGERTVWGRGYGAEAWAAVCRYLLSDVGLRKVTAGTMACNEAMLAIMRKVGMVEECRRPGQFLLNGKEIDLVCAAIYRGQDIVGDTRGVSERVGSGRLD